MATFSIIFTDLPVFRFLLASCGCVVAGLGVWIVMALCRRCLPGIDSQRSVWLLGLCTIVAAFVLILLPQSERLRLLPPIDIDSVTSAHAIAPPGATPSTPTASATVPATDGARHSSLAYVARCWLLVYALGMGHTAVKLLQTRSALRGLAAAGNPASADDVEMIEVDAPISPMLFGLFKPCLLLPLHLRSFDAIQRQMIVEHELTHLRRRDLQWASAGILLQTLLWFNPFMRLLRAKLCWAQELGCDRDVLRGRPAAQRKAYAAALLAQLRLQHAPMMTALAFGNTSDGTLVNRIALIRDPAAMPCSRWTRLAAIAGLTCVLAASLALQPSLASHATITPYACTELADAASGKRLRQEGQCSERITPASTFNIAVSLMGYDSGILIDEHAPLLPFKPGYADWNAEWRAPSDPSDWIRNSTVWYAQQVTSRLGMARFQHYVDSFGYGNQDVSGDPGKDNGLSLSWISSSLKISPSGQVDFLRKLVNRQLPLSPKAYDMTARIMHPQTLDNGWTVYGKTGTASPVLPNGHDDNQHQYGWYVGWATKGERTIVFARMVLDRRQEAYAGIRVKQAFLHELTTQLDTL